MEEFCKRPSIRFSGFTEDWEQRKLGNLGTTFNGLSGKTKEDFGIGSGEFVTYLNVFNNSISNIYLTENVEIDKKQNEVKYGDILFTTSSETPHEVGMSSVWLDNRPNVYLNSFCFGYRMTKKQDPLYMAYLLRSVSVRKQFELLAQGISRYNISKVKSMDIEVSVPCLDEQSNIGLLFNEMDKTITLHHRKLKEIESLKKTLLNKLFPNNGKKIPDYRFTGFNEDWEQRKLGDISSKVKEKNIDRRFEETLTNSAEFGIVSQRDYFDKDISNTKNLDGYYVVRNDDFVYNPRISNFAPVGPIKRNNLGRTGIMSPLYYVFRTYDVDKYFLEHYFCSNGWHQFMKLNGDSGARSDRFAIKDVTFEEMPIPFTNNEEQSKVGLYFNELDKTITLHQRKTEQLELLKKYLLKNMFV